MAPPKRPGSSRRRWGSNRPAGCSTRRSPKARASDSIGPGPRCRWIHRTRPHPGTCGLLARGTGLAALLGVEHGRLRMDRRRSRDPTQSDPVARGPGPCEHSREEAHSIMMPMTRQQVEILLDTPNQRDYVVSAYADMTVQDGFNRYVDRYLKNQARAAGEALAAAEARKDLDANLAA